jgi:uncharacterized protein YceK
MRIAAVAAICAGLVVCALSGCGTMHNFLGDSADGAPCEVFGGVRSDVRTGVKCLREPTGDPNNSALQQCAKITGWYLLAVDLPLSAVADTVTLPSTVLIQLCAGGAPSESQDKHTQRKPAQTPKSSESPQLD